MIILRENILDMQTYQELRASVGWKQLLPKQAETAIGGSLFTVCAYDGERPVGMGRIVGDGVVIDYIQDLVVRPDVQSQGIGRQIMERLIRYVRETKMEGTEIMLCLMCAKGREEFYRRFDFIARPTPMLGPGMIQYIK